MIYDVIIAGGGASGLYAASRLALCLLADAPENKNNLYFGSNKEDECGCISSHSLSVLVIEKTSRPGNKILVSGSGQCNLTHGGSIKNFLSHYGEKGKRLRRILYSHSNIDVRSHFERLGVKTIERDDGKVFPLSFKAEDVRSALLGSVKEKGFRVLLNHEVRGISVRDGIFCVHVSGADERVVESRMLVVSCGGKSFPVTGSDGSIFSVLSDLGLDIVPMSPALTPVHVNEYPYGSLSGISFENAELRIEGRKPVSGALLFTHNTLSGPLIINSSRYIKPGAKISLSYMPGTDSSTLSGFFKKKASGSKKSLELFVYECTEALNHRVPRSFIKILIERSGDALKANLEGLKASSTPGRAFDRIAKYLTEDTFTVNSLGSYDIAMVTSGGVSLDEINLDTMESKKYPHLYIVGEALDVDGDTGGYNLQFAFSSAAASVRSIIKEL